MPFDRLKGALRGGAAPAPSEPRIPADAVHYLHPGKTAGTQVKLLIAELDRLGVTPRIVGRGHGARINRVPEGARYTFSVREPVARFYSGFYSRLRKGRPAHDSEWSADEALAFEAFAHATELGEALSDSGERRSLAVKALLSIQHVGDEQVGWFLREGFVLERRPPVHILRQEKLASDIDVLLTALGITERPALDRDDPRAHRSDYSGIPPLSDLARTNLGEWYRRDVEFYRICDAWADENARRVLG